VDYFIFLQHIRHQKYTRTMKKTTFLLVVGGLMLLSLTHWQGDPDDEKRKPENAVSNLVVADGLQVQLFASEPTLTNPTNMDIDDRGRVWVCEAYNYRPEINGNPVHPEGDRIVVLEDTDHDGAADRHTVFYQGPEVESPLGIWVMGQRVIVSQSPYLWLFTDSNDDGRADKKEILLQGIAGRQHDHGLHAVVFGPDGKFYFNFGNAGERLLDKNGQPILDQDGQPIDPDHYRQGMVFRCDADFRNFEVLGHNFRNNYEVALDSYGNMWQSDNDDDGNRGVRINYVMDYGNYGYTDEMTGAGWQTNRTNLEAEIPHRHWHLNDPGVVPNLLQTGSGSPCGMAVYEGDLLPEPFRNQPLHAEAGHNVVRTYAKTTDGAGYKAQIINLLESKTDQWFRPCDVCVAPDGSVFVADWYDPGVGGHAAGDQNRGRVFRVAPPSAARYFFEKNDYSTVDGALVALANPNLSVRYQAWTALHRMGASAESGLAQVFRYHPDDVQRVRAFWLLAKGANGAAYVQEAATDAHSNIRIAAIRAARQGCAPIGPLVKKLANTHDPQVRRECAIALRHSTDPNAPSIWAGLAAQHNGKDRWYLEALGIGADGNWDAYFAAYQKLVGERMLRSAAGQDIVWRARCAAAAPFLGQLATDEAVPLAMRLRYFRAFDFHTDRQAASQVLLGIVSQKSTHPVVAKYALRHLDAEFVKANPTAKAALLELMAQQSGEEYLEFAGRYLLEEQHPRLLNMIVQNTDRHRAADVLLRHPKGLKMFEKELRNRKWDERTLHLLDAIRWNGGATQLAMLEKVAFDKKRSELVRRTAFEYLGNSWGGEDRVVNLLKTNRIDKKYIPAAVQGVSNAWRMPIRLEAQRYLPGASADATRPVPAIADLVKLKGEVASGQALFAQHCATCHQVNGEGINYGPALSDIGSKLPPEGQFMAILYPSAGVSFGYEGWELRLTDGSTVTGLIASDTKAQVTVKSMGGKVQDYPRGQVKSRQQMSESLMTAGFHYAMSDQQLADLVAYLMTLKKS
jgi:putative membrane-bound dehydrogenase-like protein